MGLGFDFHNPHLEELVSEELVGKVSDHFLSLCLIVDVLLWNNTLEFIQDFWQLFSFWFFKWVKYFSKANFEPSRPFRKDFVSTSHLSRKRLYFIRECFFKNFRI